MDRASGTGRRRLLAAGIFVAGLILGSAGTVVTDRASTSFVTAGTDGGSAAAYPTTMMGSTGSGMMGIYDPSRLSGMWTWAMSYPAGMMGGATAGQAQGHSLTLAQAQQAVQRYTDRFSNPHLALDEIIEFQNNVYAIVADRSTGHGAFEVLVNKVTGAVFPEYGPAMMWNTRYGMMGAMMGYQPPSGAMTVSSQQATRIARVWLARRQPGSATEAPDLFPGYYTLHIRRNGTITGMLSVNGYSGQVWYHTWHGAFIRMKDLHA